MNKSVEQENVKRQSNSPIQWPVSVAILLLNLAIIICGYFIYKNQQSNLTNGVKEDVNSVAHLKVQNVEQWREERVYNARIFYGNQNFCRQVALFIKNKGQSDQENMKSWLNIALNDKNFDQITIFDSNDSPIINLPKLTPLIPSDIRLEISNIKAGDSISFLDFFQINKKAYLGLLIPICNKENPDQLVAKIYIRIDPEVFLFPFIEKWPTNSESGETLLARRSGESVQFLNHLHFGVVKPMELTFSINDTSIAAVKGLNGRYGVFLAVDYRRIPVISAVQAIKNSPWILVSKEDQSEAFHELKTRLLFTLVLIGATILILTILLLWTFRRQGMNYYRNLYQRQKERDWLFDIMDHNLNEIYVFDAETLKFQFVNYGARLNLGYSMSEMKGLTPIDIKPLINLESFENIIQPLKSGEVQVQNFITVHQRKDGTQYPVEVFLEFMDSDLGKVFLAMINDITNRVKIEQKLSEQREELIHKNKELETVNEELQVTVEELQQTGEELETTNEELSVNIQQISMLNKEVLAAKEIAETANRLKSTFLANMSHEIRTPLNGIMGFSELLVEAAEDAELQRMAEIILNSSNRLLNTVNSILDISLLESGSLVVHPKKVRVQDLIQESVRLYSVFAEKKGIQLFTTIHSDLAALADEDLTLKVINNLVNNALKFTNEGSISIEQSTENFDNQSWLTIKVIDTGIGISEENMPFLFEEFRQFNFGVARQHTGSGLGLNISARYAGIMNGRLTAKSSLGKGSTFTLWLPEYV